MSRRLEVGRVSGRRAPRTEPPASLLTHAHGARSCLEGLLNLHLAIQHDDVRVEVRPASGILLESRQDGVPLVQVQVVLLFHECTESLDEDIDNRLVGIRCAGIGGAVSSTGRINASHILRVTARRETIEQMPQIDDLASRRGQHLCPPVCAPVQ